MGTTHPIRLIIICLVFGVFTSCSATNSSSTASSITPQYAERWAGPVFFENSLKQLFGWTLTAEGGLLLTAAGSEAVATMFAGGIVVLPYVPLTWAVLDAFEQERKHQATYADILDGIAPFEFSMSFLESEAERFAKEAGKYVAIDQARTVYGLLPPLFEGAALQAREEMLKRIQMISDTMAAIHQRSADVNVLIPHAQALLQDLGIMVQNPLNYPCYAATFDTPTTPSYRVSVRIPEQITAAQWSLNLCEAIAVSLPPSEVSFACTPIMMPELWGPVKDGCSPLSIIVSGLDIRGLRILKDAIDDAIKTALQRLSVLGKFTHQRKYWLRPILGVWDWIVMSERKSRAGLKFFDLEWDGLRGTVRFAQYEIQKESQFFGQALRLDAGGDYLYTKVSSNGISPYQFFSALYDDVFITAYPVLTKKVPAYTGVEVVELVGNPRAVRITVDMTAKLRSEMLDLFSDLGGARRLIVTLDLKKDIDDAWVLIQPRIFLSIPN